MMIDAEDKRFVLRASAWSDDPEKEIGMAMMTPRATWDAAAGYYWWPQKVAAVHSFQRVLPGVAVTPRAAGLFASLEAELAVLHAQSKALAPLGQPLAKAISESLRDKTSFELRPYQVAGLEFILGVMDAWPGKGVLVADEPGAGKTPMVLAAIEALNAYPALVVTTASSIDDAWRQGILGDKRFGKKGLLPWRSVRVLNGKEPDEAYVRDITIVSYGSLWRNEWIFDKQWQFVACDESSAIKNSTARQSRAVMRLRDNARRRVLMNGTPVNNRNAELIPQLEFLGWLPELGGRSGFERRFCGVEKVVWSRESGRLQEIRGSTHSKELHEEMSKRFMLRRRKDEVMPWLPAKTRDVVPVTVPATSEYWTAEEDLGAAIGSGTMASTYPDPERRRGATLAALAKLRRLVGEAKASTVAQAARDFLDANADQKMIVFGHHGAVLSALENELAEYGVVKITGESSASGRQHAIQGIQHGNARVFIGGTRSAGKSITLTKASTVFFTELDWTASEHVQAEDRSHRYGQSKAVNVRYFLGDGTVDSKVWEKVLGKALTTSRVHDGRDEEFIAAPNEGAVSDEIAAWLGKKHAGKKPRTGRVV